jgi:hypothetical protein
MMRHLQKSRFFLKAPFLPYGHPSPGGGRILLWRNKFPCTHRGKGIKGKGAEFHKKLTSAIGSDVNGFIIFMKEVLPGDARDTY